MKNFKNLYKILFNVMRIRVNIFLKPFLPHPLGQFQSQFLISSHQGLAQLLNQKFGQLRDQELFGDRLSHR